MRKKGRALLVALCAVMLVAVGVLGTLAYLTSKDSVTNTFTVGNVHIKLDEAKVNVNGEKVNANDVVDPNSTVRVEENSYHLLPGHTYVKDPTVTVLNGSEDCYVRMLVTINKQAALDAIYAPNGMPLDKFFEGYSADWKLVSEKKDVDADTRTYEFRHNAVVNGKDGDNGLDPLFTGIKVPGSITNEQLATIEGLKITVVAQAIQADGFDTADDAWAQWK